MKLASFWVIYTASALYIALPKVKSLECEVCDPPNASCLGEAMPYIMIPGQALEPGICPPHQKYCSITYVEGQEGIGEYSKSCSAISYRGCYTFQEDNTTRCSYSCDTSRCNTQEEVDKLKPQQASALSCHQCSWKFGDKDNKCIKLDKSALSACEEGASACFTLMQSIGETPLRTERGCTWFDAESTCIDLPNKEIQRGFCLTTCTENGCNGQTRQTLSIILASICLLLVTIYNY